MSDINAIQQQQNEGNLNEELLEQDLTSNENDISAIFRNEVSASEAWRLNGSSLNRNSQFGAPFVDLSEGNPFAPQHLMIDQMLKNKWRAKLYQLNAQGCWDDYGTGSFSIVRHGNDDFYITLISEDDDITELLHFKIKQNTNFSRQRGKITSFLTGRADTIITWMDNEQNIDLALSFQESKGAQDTWEALCLIQGKDPNEVVSQEDDQEEDVIPEPTYSNLGHIAEELQQPLEIMKKRRIISYVTSENVPPTSLTDLQSYFLRRLSLIFDDTEGLDEQEPLFAIFAIYKGLIALGDRKIIELLLSNDFYLDTFGALECNDDPEVFHNQNSTGEGETKSAEEQKQSMLDDAKPAALKHREFLKNQVKFKEVVSIQEESILESIHLVYRLFYLKDTAMARFIDDNVLATVNSIIYMKSQEIVNHIFYTKEILAELLSKIKNNNEVQQKHDAIEFFMEVCQLSKNTQLMSRFSFLENQDALSLIEVLSESFNICEPDLRTLEAQASGDMQKYRRILYEKYNPGNDQGNEESKGEDFVLPAYMENFIQKHEKFDIIKIDLLKISSIEILMSLIQFTPYPSVRSYICSVEQKKLGFPFMRSLINHMLYSEEQGMKIQVSEFLKSLLDPDTTEKKAEFLELFYSVTLKLFAEFLEKDAPQVAFDSLDHSRQLILQLFIKCLQEHIYRFRVFAVQSLLIDKIALLAEKGSKLLKLWVVKFFKTILRVKDELLHSYVIKKDHFRCVVNIFLDNANKQNLLHSSILELFDILTKDYNKKLGQYFVNSHGFTHQMANYEEALFRNPQFEQTFRDFVAVHEGKEESKRSNSLKPEDFVQQQLRDRIIKEDEDLMTFGHKSSGSSSQSEEEDDKYNQEMFIKLRNEHKLSPNTERMMPFIRKGSNGQSSEEEEEAVEDMGLFGQQLAEFKRKQQERRHALSPHKDDIVLRPGKLQMPDKPKQAIQFELNSPDSGQKLKEETNGGNLRERYLSSESEFVKGKRLIDPVTGRVEGENSDNEKDDDNYEQLEFDSKQSKRVKMVDNEQLSHHPPSTANSHQKLRLASLEQLEDAGQV